MLSEEITYHILSTISIFTPFEYREVRDVFNICKSFDMTISICNGACEKGINPMDVLNEMYAKNNEEDSRNTQN